VNARDGEQKVLVDQVWNLADLAATLPPATKIQIRVPLEHATTQLLADLKGVLRQQPGSRSVELLVTKGSQEKLVPTEFRVDLTPELRIALQELFGDCIVEV
jgi:hypothetical protein